MITPLEAIILGLIQGLAEFLPISSSGHLVIAPLFFGWPDQGLDFDIALHLGTLLAVVFYFWPEWRQLLTRDFKNLGVLILATAPAAIVGLAWGDRIEETVRNPLFVAFNLAFFGFILWLAAEAPAKRESVNTKTGGIIGLAQILALLPGVSRSGITYTAGRFLKLDHQAAARFSFLLSTPIIAAAGLKLPKAISAGEFNLLPVLLGFAVAAVTGFLAISLFMKVFTSAKKIKWLAAYRLLLAIVVLMVYFR